MSRKPALHALQLMTSQRWAIRREALERMVAIAERDLPALLADREAETDAVDRLKPRRALFAAPAVAHPQSERLGVRDGVAILPIVGPLCRYASWLQEVCGLTSYQLAAEDFRIAIEDPAVRAILLHFDSPGGEVNGTSELAALIHAHRGVKPIVAMVSDSCASAAYWLASAADEIVVSPAAYVGSIGVYWEIVDYSAAEAAEGIRRFQIISSQSPNKVPDPADAAGKAVLQREVDEFADAFLAQAAAYRGTTPEALVAAGDGGGIFIGRFAVERGLADRLATTEEVLAELAAGDFTPLAGPRTTARAALAPTLQEQRMKQKATALPPAASGPRAYAAGDEVRSLVARETTVAEGATGTVDEVREGATVLRMTTPDGPSGWLLVDEECELATAAPTGDGADGGEGAATGTEEDDPSARAIASTSQLAQAYPALIAQVRREAVQAERDRVRALCALDARQIAPALQAAILDGETPAKAAKAMLAANRQVGTQALAAMTGAEAALTPPAPMPTGAEGAPSTAAQITQLLEEHGAHRARRASRN